MVTLPCSLVLDYYTTCDGLLEQVQHDVKVANAAVRRFVSSMQGKSLGRTITGARSFVQDNANSKIWTHTQSKRLYWNLIYGALMVYLSMVVPYATIAVSNPNLTVTEQEAHIKWPPIIALNVLVDIFFVIDFVLKLRFWAVKKDGKWIVKESEIQKNYLKVCVRIYICVCVCDAQ
jgi:hypothetical protein